MSGMLLVRAIGRANLYFGTRPPCESFRFEDEGLLSDGADFYPPPSASEAVPLYDVSDETLIKV